MVTIYYLGGCYAGIKGMPQGQLNFSNSRWNTFLYNSSFNEVLRSQRERPGIFVFYTISNWCRKPETWLPEVVHHRITPQATPLN